MHKLRFGLDRMNNANPFGTYEPRGFVRWALEYTRTLPKKWLAQRLVYLLRTFAIRSLRGEPLDVTVFGVRMRLFPDNNMCEKRILFMPQYFDPIELGILEKRIGENFCFIDIGANVGGYTLFVAARSDGGARILAIEPQPEIFDRLSFNIRLNPFGTVKAVACAIADKQGDLTLFLDPVNRGESSLKIVGSSQAEAIRVPAMPLMDMVANEGFQRIDAMKIDAEGSEDLILGPFFENAPRSLYPTLLMIEDSHTLWQFDIPALLEKKGYRLLVRTKLNLVYELSDVEPGDVVTESVDGTISV